MVRPGTGTQQTPEPGLGSCSRPGALLGPGAPARAGCRERAWQRRSLPAAERSAPAPCAQLRDESEKQRWPGRRPECRHSRRMEPAQRREWDAAQRGSPPSKTAEGGEGHPGSQAWQDLEVTGIWPASARYAQPMPKWGEAAARGRRPEGPGGVAGPAGAPQARPEGNVGSQAALGPDGVAPGWGPPANPAPETTGPLPQPAGRPRLAPPTGSGGSGRLPVAPRGLTGGQPAADRCPGRALHGVPAGLGGGAGPGPPAGALLPRVPAGLPVPLGPGAASHQPLGAQAAPVPGLRQGLQAGLPPAAAPEHPHRRAPLPLRRLPEGLPGVGRAAAAPAGAHGREALPVPALPPALHRAQYPPAARQAQARPRGLLPGRLGRRGRGPARLGRGGRPGGGAPL
ncbi:unnamed protein product, partial [Eretmochelys imbricata]